MKLTKDQVYILESLVDMSIDLMLESTDRQERYQAFFKSKLEKYGVDSPDDLDDDEKKDFFNEIEREWKEKDENKG